MLQFAPIRDLKSLNEAARPMVRASKLDPAEVLFLGKIDGFLPDEAIVLLSEIVPIPASAFELSLQEFPEDPEDGLRCVAGRYPERLATLESPTLDLMFRKMLRFWSGFDVAAEVLDERVGD